jgi:hypothetical protein
MTDPILIYFGTLAFIVWIAHAIDDSEPAQSGDELPWRKKYDGEIEYRRPTNYDGLTAAARSRSSRA